MDAESQKIRDSLSESMREVLKLLGDLDELENRTRILKNKLNKIYSEVDNKLDKVF